MENAVIFTTLETELLEQLKKVKQHLDAENSTVHIVHCHKIQMYINELSVFTFPTENEIPQMTEATNQVLEQFAKELSIKKYTVETFFDHDPKERCLNYLKEKNATLCVLGAKKKSGVETLFEGSFISYMNKFSPCDILTLRPLK